MYSTPLWRIILMILLIGATGCATGPESINPYFETPPDRLPVTEQELYNKALVQLKNNHPDDSIKLWKRFLEHNPRSFKGYNNLGMAHYSNDQLEKSISAFETALALEPFDLKIKDNLKRSLRFQVTILRENKDYEKSILLLERVKELTAQPGKEKVALEIEQLQDLIFEQVKRTNTLENYEAFLEKYPDNPINADEARRQIATMKPQESPMGKFPEMQDEFISAPGQRPSKSMQESLVSEPFVPEPAVPAPSPIQKETIEIVAETQKPDEEEEIPLDIQDDPAMEEAVDVPAPPKAPEALKVPEAPRPRAMKQPEPMEPLPTSESDMEMKRETSSMDSQTPKSLPTKRVRIETRHAPLRVRMEPDALSKVVAQVPKGSIVQVFQEEKGWYQIEYKKGKKGWISKKYSRLIK
jgi:hypothetical protein